MNFWNWKMQWERKTSEWTPTIHRRHPCSHPERELAPLTDPSQENTKVRIQWRHYLLHKIGKWKAGFFLMSRTQRMSLRWNKEEPVFRVEDHVCVMCKPVPSPIITSSDPLYGEWRDRLSRSEVMWCEAPLSNNHEDASEHLLLARWAWGCHGFGLLGDLAGTVVVWLWGTNLKDGHLFAVCPCMPQTWQWPR